MRARRQIRLIAVGALCLALSLVWAVPAFGQTATAIQFQSTVLENTVVQVQMWPEAEADATVLIVGATLPTDTPLPTTIDMPLPAGATVTWAGEIGGEDVTADISRDWEIVAGEGGSAVRFLVETFYSVQFEAALPAPVVENGRVVSQLDWVQTVPSDGMSLAWRIPANTDDVSMNPDAPGTPLTNGAGERLYTLQSVMLEPGGGMSFQASYTRAGLAGSSSSGIQIVTVLWWLLGIAAVVLGMVIVRQRQLAAASAEEYEE